MKGNRGGKSHNDRVLAAQVRTLALNEIKRILEGDDEYYKKELVLKLSTNLLPRLNEHTGADGKDLPVPILYVQSDNSNPEDNGSKKED